MCKDHCELIFDKFSKKAHAGYKVDAVIPHVGRLSISIGICAVIFNDDIIGQSRGKTAINHMKRHHSAYIRNNLVNTKNLENDPNKTGFNKLKEVLDKKYEANKQNEVNEI